MRWLLPCPVLQRAIRAQVAVIHEKHGDEFIQQSEFAVIVKKYPGLLYPMQELQNTLMQKNLGFDWWQARGRYSAVRIAAMGLQVEAGFRPPCVTGLRYHYVSTCIDASRVEC